LGCFLMSRLLPESLVAIIAFASTNIDDLLLLSSLFIASNFRPASVVIGQFIGMSLLVLTSVLVAYFMVSIPLAWIGTLGLFPLCLGVLRLAKGLRVPMAKSVLCLKEREFFGKEQLRVPWMKSEWALAALLTVANGGDNLSVYIPLFAVQHTFVPLYVTVFGVMTGIWCFFGYFLTHHRLFRDKLKRHAETIVPWVLILLGLKVLLHERFGS
jgi:cadmium resistance protein CadD (predicted permease)